MILQIKYISKYFYKKFYDSKKASAMFFCLVFSLSAYSGEIHYDCFSFVQEAMRKDPIVQEKRFSTQLKKEKLASLKAEAILPSFSFYMLVGPAPGLRQEMNDKGNTVDVWDFKKMGPFWGTQVKAVQPLNLGQYRVGKKAIQADIHQHQFGIIQEEHKKEVELQSYYYNYLLALEMKRLAEDAQKQIDDAYIKLEDALDNDDPGVSQMDLLKLKSNMHVIQEGVSDANTGLKQVMLAIRFSLQLDSAFIFKTKDTTLNLRGETLYSLEKLQNIALKSHPELKQLRIGLEAKSYQMDLAEAKLSPEFFIMGEFEYAKSWAGGRDGIQKDVFSEDVVNKLSGALGVGLRYRLNFWSNWQKYKEAKVEYKSLKMKDKYAVNGILLKLEEQYYKVSALKEKVENLRNSQRASEAMLKGYAIQYDLDPSNPENLISAYTQNVNLLKNYYFAICAYNIEFAELIYRTGLSYTEFYETYVSK